MLFLQLTRMWTANRGLFFDMVQLKDGKPLPVAFALMSVAPQWQPGGSSLGAAATRCRAHSVPKYEWWLIVGTDQRIRQSGTRRPRHSLRLDQCGSRREAARRFLPSGRCHGELLHGRTRRGAGVEKGHVLRRLRLPLFVHGEVGRARQRRDSAECESLKKVWWRRRELNSRSTLSARNLLILKSDRNARIAQNADPRYTAGTRASARA